MFERCAFHVSTAHFRHPSGPKCLRCSYGCHLSFLHLGHGNRETGNTSPAYMPMRCMPISTCTCCCTSMITSFFKPSSQVSSLLYTHIIIYMYISILVSIYRSVYLSTYRPLKSGFVCFLLAPLAMSHLLCKGPAKIER